jgi:acyl-CoA dehydrogenase
MLCTSLYAGRQQDELIRRAGDGLCRHLTRGFTGSRVSDRDLRDLTSLGEAIADGQSKFTAGVDALPIMMAYRN